MLSEQRAVTAFAVVIYTCLYNVTSGAVILGKTVDTEKLGDVTGDELSVYREIVSLKRHTALFAGFIIFHIYILTTLA